MTTELIHVRQDGHLRCDADPFGAWPMYVTGDGKGGAFVATSQRQLRDAGVQGGLDPESIRRWLLGLSGRPLLEGVRRVPPRASLWVDRGEVKILGGGLPTRADTSGMGRRQLQTVLLDRLGDAVDRNVGSRRPACLLSGELDSISLLLLVEDRNPRAWTLISGPSDPALKPAILMATECKADHQVVEAPEDELPDAFEAAVRACEVPIYNGRAVAQYLLYEVIAQAGDTSVLSGVGADELLMGNPARIVGRTGQPAPVTVRHVRDRGLLRQLLLPEWAAREDSVELAMTPGKVREHMIQRILPEEVLPPECRSAHAHGLEVLLPYLDVPFASLALGIDEERLIEGKLGKLPLREAWSGTLPDEVRLAPTVPCLSPPAGGSAAAHRKWAALFDGLLTADRIKTLQVVDHRRVRAMAQAYGTETRWNHPNFRPMERVLMRLASLTVLTEHLG